ncbi:hypothetical protein GNP94_14950 [Paenibacillus campinasensis]|jgi:hypothetical protein|uniref:SIR2-like domain-containing protein n=1 Tax=Paenibacillus campinasensis TaxID=66347 RepID=A0ABW9T1X4_9BACL|nr:SIR2 family protein [Paenibacillus campinasensis]MUG67285.1 hypothetical protein [Paenibacillus campinasensis]
MDLVSKENMYYIRGGHNLFENVAFEEQIQTISSLLKMRCSYSENLHFLIGSGCSRNAIPLMNDTFDIIKSNHADVRMVFEQYTGEKDIESFLSWLATAMKFFTEGSNEYKKYDSVYTIIKKEFLRSINLNLFRHETDLALDDQEMKTLQNYINFYNGVFSHRQHKKVLSPINVFTTNYDLFNEIAFEKLKIHYTNGFSGFVTRTFDPSVFHIRLVDEENRYKDKWNPIRKYVKLYKIHGSIDWQFDVETKTIKQRKLDLDNTSNVVIFPTMLKHFETQQTPYSELFREFTVNLQKKNSTLIVLGYGFPDEHINQLIAQSLYYEDFNLIIFGNQNEEKAKAFIDANGDHSNFHFIGGDFENKNDAHYFANVIRLLGDDVKNATPDE